MVPNGNSLTDSELDYSCDFYVCSSLFTSRLLNLLVCVVESLSDGCTEVSDNCFHIIGRLLSSVNCFRLLQITFWPTSPVTTSNILFNQPILLITLYLILFIIFYI